MPIGLKFDTIFKSYTTQIIAQMEYLLSRLFCCFCKRTPFIDVSVDPETFTSAGVFFTDGIHVLVGEQNSIDRIVLSGIGGKKEYDETYMETALREMIEELFDIMHVPKNLIKLLQKTYTPQMVFQVYTYITVVYSLNDLESMLYLISNFGLHSKAYVSIPLSLDTLIENRIDTFDSEIKSLTILSLSMQNLPFKPIHIDFIHDIEKYKELQHMNVSKA
jgi:hypothetical protein